MTISLRQLQYLSALGVSGHFGRAAAAVGVTQPALSMQIRELEAALGGALVERRPAGAILTELGLEVAARSAQILAAMRDLEELALVHDELLAGRLRLGIIPSVAPYLLPRLMECVRERHPKLELTLRETVTPSLVDELAAGELDAIIASLPLGREDLAEAPAIDDVFLLAVPRGSPHAERSPALAELISADELMLLEDGHCLRDQALDVCRAIDPRRLRSFGATSLSTILQMVAAGQGITLLPELAVDAAVRSDPRLKLIRFSAPEPRRTLGVAWRKSSPRARDFRALADLVRGAAKG